MGTPILPTSNVPNASLKAQNFAEAEDASDAFPSNGFSHVP
jgi:hypothetical protein